MVTLLHISDLHFGRARARRLADAILRAEQEIGPSAVVCSGDLVEWSETDGPWRELKGFLDRLATPRLVIPGNHDIARFNPLGRLFAPFERYNRFVAPELDTVLEVPGAVMVGLGTPRRWTLDLGYVSKAQLDQARDAFARAPDDALRVVAIHHGPRSMFRRVFRNHVWGSQRAVRELVDMGADLVLTGHNHFPHVEELGRHGRGPTVWSQAGTAGCHRRRRCHNNSISVVRAERHRLTIEWWFYDDTTHRFAHHEAVQVVRSEPSLSVRTAS